MQTGITPRDKEYARAMQEAQQEYDAWYQDARKDRKLTKEKYKAQRLAKLHMQEMM